MARSKMLFRKTHSKWLTFLNTFVLLSAALSLLARPQIEIWVRNGVLEPHYIFVGPAIFGFFLFLIIITHLFSRYRNSKAILAPAFGLVLLLFLLPSSFREYAARKAPEVATNEFIQEFLNAKDARIRALTMLSATCAIRNDEEWSRVIDSGLTDKDPIVQEAAKYALSEKFGINLPVGDDGIALARETLRIWQTGEPVAQKGIQ